MSDLQGSSPAANRATPATPGPDLARLDRLILHVVDSIAAAHPDEGALQELLQALPDHPKVQQMASCAAVVGFDWPLRREPYSPRAAEAPAPADIDLVYFHADRPVAAGAGRKPFNYLSVLALSMESAALMAPPARRVLLTDEATEVPAALPVHDVRRLPMDVTRLMRERMRAQEAYLAGRPDARASILLDSDIVVNREPSAAFGEAFDVALTWRSEYPDAPFNGGVIFVAGGGAGRNFFRHALACYDALAADAHVASRFPHDLRSWDGDQYALAATIGYREIAAYRDAGIRVEDIAVRFLPCAEYNYTPVPGANRSGADGLRSKFFIHFKGNRKEIQESYLKQMRRKYRKRS